MWVAHVIAIVVVGYLVLRRGRDLRAGSIKAAQGLRICGLIPLGLQVAVFLLFGIGEMASGEAGGAGHLLQVAVAVLLGTLAWMRPLEGGIALFASGVLSAIGSLTAMVASGPLLEPAVLSPGAMILAAPLLLSGVLFFFAGMLSRRAASADGD